MSSSFCKECRKKCNFSESDDDSISDTSSEYYHDSSDSELPIDLTNLSISSNEPETSEETSEEPSSELPIDLTSLSISSNEPETSEEPSEESSELPSSEPETSEEPSEESSELPIDLTSLSISSSEPSEEPRKRKRGSTVSDNSDYTDSLDFSKLSIKEPEAENVSQLSQLLSSMFVSQKQPEEDELDILTSNLSRKLRVSPKKKRKENSESMDVEDVPIKQRLRKSIKKRTKGGLKIVPRETWSSKSE